MSIIHFEDNNLKIFDWAVCKVRYKKGQTKFYAFGVPLFQVKDPFDALRRKFAKETDFNTISYDEKVEQIVSEYQNIQKGKQPQKRLAFLATKIYDMGGHTKWLRDMEKTLCDDYEQTLFLTTKKTSIKAAPQTIEYLQKFSDIKFFNQFSCSCEHNIREIYDSIVDYAPQALFVFIHPDDFIATAVIALIRQHTNIKVFFVNHATHRPALAMSLCDLVLEETPSSAYVTQKLRGLQKTHIIGLISKCEADNPQYTKQQIENMRATIGIPKGAICTMSGAASYKFFDKKGTASRYFEMIHQMLKEHENVYHVVITAFQKHEKALVDKMFADSPVKNRLILLPYQEDYELAFKCADLFIDSFPMGSAVAMIDLMRLKVPYVVKINTENSALSFHEYQSPDFPYMYETVADFYAGIKELLANPQKRMQMTGANYQYYLTHYEPKAAHAILMQTINCSDFATLVDKLDPKVKYKLNFEDECLAM